MTSKAEKQQYAKVANLGCALCRYLGYGESPPELHHIRRAGIRSQSPVIPLCTEHHRGNTGIHGMGRKAFERKYQVTEEELLTATLELL